MSLTINLICICPCIPEGIHLVEKQTATEWGMQWLDSWDIFRSADVSVLRFHVGFLGRTFTRIVADCSQTDDAEGNVDKSDTALDFSAYCPGKSLSSSPFLWCLGESN